MTTYETSVKLRLWPDGDNICLVIEINIPQFMGKKLTAPDSPTYIDNDKSKILVLYNEADDPEVATSTQIQHSFSVPIGSIIKDSETALPRTLSECVTATANSDNPILSEYTVTLEIAGNNNRKTVTHISDDADIDLIRKSLANLEENNPIA